MNKLKKVFRSPLGFDTNKHSRQRKLSLVSYASDIPHNQSAPDVSYVNYDQHSLTPSHAEHSVKYSNPTSSSGHFFNKLHKWAFLGDVGKVKKFIKKIDVNCQDQEGRAALHVAASAGHIEVILVLIGARADPELSDRDGRTPFLIAVKKNQVEVVQVLLQYKVNSGVSDNLGNGALHLAASSGGKNILEILLDSGLKPDVQNSFDQTPLHVAAENLNIDAVVLLIERGNPVNTPDKEGVTALMLVAKVGSNQLVDLLLEAGADPLMTDSSGWNAPSYAKYSMHEKLEEKLVNAIKSKVKSASQPPTPVISGRLPSPNPDDSWADSVESLDKQKLTYFTAHLDNDSESSRTLPSKNMQLSSKLSLGPPKPPRQFTSTPNIADECSLERSTSDPEKDKRIAVIRHETSISKQVRRSKSLSRSTFDSASEFERTSKDSLGDHSDDRTLGSDVAFEDEEADLPSGVFEPSERLPESVLDVSDATKVANTTQEIEGSKFTPSPMQGCDEMWQGNDQMKSNRSPMPPITEQTPIENKIFNEYGYTKMYFGDSQENVYIEIEPLKKERESGQSPRDSEVLSDIVEDHDGKDVLTTLRQLKDQLQEERNQRLAQAEVLHRSSLENQNLEKKLKEKEDHIEEVCKENNSTKKLLELLQQQSSLLESDANHTLKALTETNEALEALEEKTEPIHEAQSQRTPTVHKAIQIDLIQQIPPPSVASVANQTEDLKSVQDMSSQVDALETCHASTQSDVKETNPITTNSITQTESPGDITTYSVGCQVNAQPTRVITKEASSQSEENQELENVSSKLNEVISKNAGSIVEKLDNTVISQVELVMKCFEKGQDKLLEDLEGLHHKEASQRLQMEEHFKESNQLDELLNHCRNQSDLNTQISQKLRTVDQLVNDTEKLTQKVDLLNRDNPSDLLRDSFESKFTSLSNDITECINNNLKNVDVKIDFLQSKMESALRQSQDPENSNVIPACTSNEVIQESLDRFQSTMSTEQTKLENSLNKNFHDTLNTMNETVDENFQIVLDTMQEVEQNVLKSLSKNIPKEDNKEIGKISETLESVKTQVYLITEALNKPTEKGSKYEDILNTIQEQNFQCINSLKSQISSLNEHVEHLQNTMETLTDHFKDFMKTKSTEMIESKAIVPLETSMENQTLQIPKINVLEIDSASPEVKSQQISKLPEEKTSPIHGHHTIDDTFQSQIIQKSRSFKELEFRLRELEVDVGELEEELTLRNHENIRLKQTVTDQHKQLVACRQDITRFTELQSNCVSLNQQIRNLENIVSNKQMVIGSLEQSLAMAKEDNSSLLSNIATLKENIARPPLPRTDSNTQETSQPHLNVLYQEIESKFESLFASKLKELNNCMETKTNVPEAPSIDMKAREALDLMLERMMDLKNEIVDLHSKIEMSNQDKQMWMDKYQSIVERYNRLGLETGKTQEMTQSLNDSKEDFSSVLQDIEACLKQPYPESKFLLEIRSLSSPDGLSRPDPMAYEPFPIAESEHDSTSMESDLSSLNYGSTSTSII